MFPATSKPFNINDQIYTMQMLTLGLMAKMEDETTEVTYLDIITGCTNIPQNVLEFIPDDQLNVICDDIIEYSNDKKQGGEKKSAISLIAWFMNKGHFDAQYYRIDFVRVIIKEMENEIKNIEKARKAKK